MMRRGMGEREGVGANRHGFCMDIIYIDKCVRSYFNLSVYSVNGCVIVCAEILIGVFILYGHETI